MRQKSLLLQAFSSKPLFTPRSTYVDRTLIQEILEIVEQADGQARVRFNWHTLSFRYKTVDHFYGSSFYTLDTRGENQLIKAKKVVLKNDYVRQIIDVYHI